MGKVRLSYRLINERVVRSPRAATQFKNAAQKKFEILKSDFLQEFLDHPVTQDIKAGYSNPESHIDSAGVLGGYGNLYSFLGLDHSKGDPIDPVYETLKRTTVMTISNIKSDGANNKQIIRVITNLRTDRPALFGMTRLIWDNGLSWLYSIETGISGLSHYLSKKLENPP